MTEPVTGLIEYNGASSESSCGLLALHFGKAATESSNRRRELLQRPSRHCGVDQGVEFGSECAVGCGQESSSGRGQFDH